MGGLLSVDPVKIQGYNVTDDSFVRPHLNAAGETLLFSSVFQYTRDFSNRLHAQYFVLGMRLSGHNSYMMDRLTVRLTAPVAWARR